MNKMATNQITPLAEAIPLEHGEAALVGSFYHRLVVESHEGSEIYTNFVASVQTVVAAKRALVGWILDEWANGYCPPSDNKTNEELDFNDSEVVATYLSKHSDDEIIYSYFAFDPENTYEIEQCWIQPLLERSSDLSGLSLNA